MIYAQIQNNMIMNAIVVSEDTPLELFSEGFQYFIRIDTLTPQPGIGWSYDGNIFTRPPDPPDDTEEEL